MASTKIRRSFLDFFKSKSHTIVPGNFAGLIAATEDKPISPTSTKAVGCVIPGAR